MSEKEVYVIERYEPHLAEVTIVGVWVDCTAAHLFVNDALNVEMLQYMAEGEYFEESFSIQRSNTASPDQTYYSLVEKEMEYETLGYYITKVVMHE